jgi:hypothetical protein
MNIDKAIDISGMYGEVLEKLSNERLLMKPISKLPFSKDTIKLAVRICLAGVQMETVPKYLQDSLEVAYISLADFIEDDQAKYYNEFLLSLSTPLDKQVLIHSDNIDNIDKIVEKERNNLNLEVTILRSFFQLT